MRKKPKIVITDGYTLNPNDLSWKGFADLGELIVYDHTPANVLLDRIHDADILIVNKTPISAETIAALPYLRYIGVLATGYNNIDTRAAAARHIPVCNVVGYGAKSVAQHVFALILELTNQVGIHHNLVQAGAWGSQVHFSFWQKPLMELAGKTLGIYGYGTIGREVARLGQAFGMKPLIFRRHTVQRSEGLPRGMHQASLENLFRESDILSLNAAMSDDNQGLINHETLALMKPTALLINTARGGFIVEADLRAALESGKIAGAGLDVLAVEPPISGSCLFGLQNCLITPHQAWASVESRQRLMRMSVANLKAFLAGKPFHQVS